MQALEEILVVELSKALPAQTCGMILGDHGARVIRVEGPQPPEWSATAPPLPTIERNKEHIILDLSDPGGREALERLLSRADVLLQGFRPGVAQRYALDYGSVSARHPRLVYATIGGYGADIAHRDRPGHDANFLAETGSLEFFTRAGERARLPAAQLGASTASLHAVIGILLALHARSRTGHGQAVHVAITDALMASHILPFSFAQAGWPVRCGEFAFAHGLACYDTYLTADEVGLVVAAVEPLYFRRLCELLGLPELVPLQFEPGAQDRIRQVLSATFGTRPVAHWRETIVAAGVCVSEVLPFAEAVARASQHGQAVVELPDGTAVLGIPQQLSATPGAISREPVARGSDTAAVLRELGFNECEAAALATLAKPTGS